MSALILNSVESRMANAIHMIIRLSSIQSIAQRQNQGVAPFKQEYDGGREGWYSRNDNCLRVCFPLNHLSPIRDLWIIRSNDSEINSMFVVTNARGRLLWGETGITRLLIANP